MKNIYTKIGFGALILTPFITFATEIKNLKELIKEVVTYFNIGLELIIALAVIIFIWNVFQYLIAAGEVDKKAAGNYVLYSVIGFFIIVSFWGLVNILLGTFNLNNNAPAIPGLNFTGGNSGAGDVPIKVPKK